MADTLVRKNVSIHGRRTSLRLEAEIWGALDDICKLEDLNVHQVCTHIERQRAGFNRTSALRAFIVSYFREAATREGHIRAGHGRLAGRVMPLARRPGTEQPVFMATGE